VPISLHLLDCDLQDVIIEWEQSDYTLYTKDGQSDYGVKVCAVASDVIFPVWFRFNTSNPKGIKVLKI